MDIQRDTHWWEIVEEDIYSESVAEECLENDEINPEEQAFMAGYAEAR